MTPYIKLFLTPGRSFGDLVEARKAADQVGLYRQIVLELTKSGLAKQSLQQLGDRLVTIAETAYAFREMDTVEQAGRILFDIPLPEKYESIGLYYRTLCKVRRGKFNEARASIERIVDQAPLLYRAKALMSMGTISWQNGDSNSAWSLYLETLRVAADRECRDLPTMVQTHRAIAVLKSLHGDHTGALADLENLFPLVRAIASTHPHIYYDHLNSLAVELGQVGRLEEAGHASRIANASRFAAAYPEWRETGEELAAQMRRPSRSIVALNRACAYAGNIVPLPERKVAADFIKDRANRFQKPARVLDFQKWKKSMAAEETDISEMSSRDMMLKILNLISERSLTDDQLERMMLAVEAISLGSTS